MEDTVRNVAWSIAEAWWRKKNRVAAGSVPEATSSTDYADNFWQGWTEEAERAIACMAKMTAQRKAAATAGISAAIARI